MKKEMLINVLQPEEIRIAIVEDGVLEELYVERTSLESYVGNIYKGRIVNIEPSIQAAFVDFGIGRNGFLHVSDVEPAYYRHLEPRRGEGGRQEARGRDRGRGEEPRRDEAEGPAGEGKAGRRGRHENHRGRSGRSRRRPREQAPEAAVTAPQEEMPLPAELMDRGQYLEAQLPEEEFTPTPAEPPTVQAEPAP